MPYIETSSTSPAVRIPNGARAAEELLIDIIDAVREPLLVLAPDFRVTHANRSFFRAFRVEARDTIGKGLFTIGDGQWNIPPLHALLHDLVSELLGTASGTAPQLRDVDVDHVFPRIGRKTMLLNATLVSRGPDEQQLILLAIEDVTEQRDAERLLAAQRRELERSNAALEDFASIAAHDLQEPLRKILSFGERLNAVARPTLHANASRYLDRLLSAATRMRALINDMLTYSQVMTRVQDVARADLNLIARETVAELETVIADAGGRVEIGELPVLDVDPIQMRQLLQNLLTNALKYRRADRPLVVRISSTSPDDAHRTLIVTDNGIGFNQHYAERIFKMFERLHGRTQYEGSGIGLAICWRIAERHGGTITAISSPGEGATFTVTLPISQTARGLLP